MNMMNIATYFDAAPANNIICGFIYDKNCPANRNKNGKWQVVVDCNVVVAFLHSNSSRLANNACFPSFFIFEWFARKSCKKTLVQFCNVCTIKNVSSILAIGFLQNRLVMRYTFSKNTTV